MASPPPEAADGFDANAPPPTRTPDGDADLLPPSSPAVAPAPHLRDTPPSDVADLSIDDDTGVEGGDGGAVDDSPLEVNYGEDDDDDEEEEDDGEEGDEGAEDEEDGDTAVTDGTPVAGAGGSSSAAEALARRTDAIMSSYKDYIDEITSEPVEAGDPTAALADLEMQNGGGHGGFGFAYPADASDRTSPASNMSLADVPMPDGSDASTVGMGTVGRGGYMGSVRDDASFEDFYGELSFHPRRNYRWPILRNRKFQVCCFGAVLGVVLLGVIAGVASRSIHPGGGVKVAGEEIGGSGGGRGGGTLTDIVTTTNPISAKPITTIIPTADSSDAQSSNFNDDRPVDGGGDATAARNPLPPEGRPDPNPDYEAIIRIYKPQWFGRTSGWTGNTYISALAFCAAEKSMMLCPYKAICPHGKDTRPYGGHESTWAPLGDSLNAWVSLSAHDSCALYSSMYENPPDWGLTGSTERDVTPNVMCCELNAENEAGGVGVGNVGSGSMQQNNGLQQNTNMAKTPPTLLWPGLSTGTTVPPTAADNEDLSVPAVAYAKEKYKPVPYDRSSGWTGQTYDAAFGFCASTSRDGAALMLCPYEAVCPMGPMNRPYEIFVGSGNNQDSWIPVSNEHNWWVQVGPTNPCVFYSVLHDEEHPYWGLTGRGNEEITQHILCCDEHEVTNVIGTVKEPMETQLDDETMAVVNDASQQQQPPVEGKEEGGPPSVTEIMDRHRPKWYHRGEGWKGSSYPEAIEFCSSKGIICPYEAYCPWGEGSTPFEGSSIADDISWAPISDRVNDWVSVGSKGGCEVWSGLGNDEGAKPPDWGMSGNEEMTRHIACCNTDNLAGGISGTSVPGSQTSAAKGGDGQPAAAALANFYQPQWFHRPYWSGTSFQHFVEFCAQQTLTLCPYEALCPEGRGNPPFLTSYEEPSGSWAPVTNSFNDWVRVSSEDGEPCARFSEEHGGDLPKWGTVAEGGREDLTRHVLCCQTRAEDSGLYSAQQIMPHEPGKHHPRWYDLDGGWTGATYDGAVQFCAQNDGQVVCPADAICPGVGNMRIPVGGVHDHDEEPGGAWAPVFDRHNEWIRVSSEDLCVLYSSMHGEEPDWGLHGEREDLTRHIACCYGDHPTVAGALADAVMPSGSQRPVDQISPGMTDNTLLPPEAMIFALYNPIWYVRDDGWDGTTWSRAVEYCKTRNGALCPREAYCPDGQNLIRGEIDDGTNAEGWAPVSDAINEWVRVSLTSGNKCALWSSMHDAPPEWDGEGEVVTRHVMCCTPMESGGVEDVGVHDEMGPHLKPTTGVTVTAKTTTTTTATTEATAATKTEAATTTKIEGTPSTNEATAQAPAESVLASQTFQQAEKKYLAKWHDRSTGWKGRTYAEALKFCAEKGSAVPCPYEAYCPIGPGTHVTGGMRTEKTFAPIIDTPNGWVSVGPDDTCVTHNALAPPPEWGLTGVGNEEITRYILCCHEPEDGFGIALVDEQPIIDPTFDVGVERSPSELAVMDIYHPLWYGRRQGYHGGSHADAERFCANVGGKRLCPEAAYCPNGVATQAGPKVLFLDRMAFEGEQWAPISDDGTGHNWVMVGTVGGFPTSTCATYESLKELSTWVGSDKPSVHKQHVLCCADEKVVNQVETIEKIIKETMKPVWFDEIDGWTGGSWGDAELFCQGRGGRELCSYTAYCPYGNGKHVMGGHRYDFDAEGEQWAPFSGVPNSWVMIGQKYQNSATTCMTFEWLEGGSPGQWGNVNAMSELKRHIMCCMPEDGS